jgi:hypothetical protein
MLPYFLQLGGNPRENLEPAQSLPPADENLINHTPRHNFFITPSTPYPPVDAASHLAGTTMQSREGPRQLASFINVLVDP